MYSHFHDKVKTAVTSLLASPNQLLCRLALRTLMKTAPDSLAIALAIIVLPAAYIARLQTQTSVSISRNWMQQCNVSIVPVPGGPYKRMPLMGLSNELFLKISGLWKGNTTSSTRAFFTDSIGRHKTVKYQKRTCCLRNPGTNGNNGQGSILLRLVRSSYNP